MTSLARPGRRNALDVGGVRKGSWPVRCGLGRDPRKLPAGPSTSPPEHGRTAADDEVPGAGRRIARTTAHVSTGRLARARGKRTSGRTSVRADHGSDEAPTFRGIRSESPPRSRDAPYRAGCHERRESCHEDETSRASRPDASTDRGSPNQPDAADIAALDAPHERPLRAGQRRTVSPPVRPQAARTCSSALPSCPACSGSP